MRRVIEQWPNCGGQLNIIAVARLPKMAQCKRQRCLCVSTDRLESSARLKLRFVDPKFVGKQHALDGRELTLDARGPKIAGCSISQPIHVEHRICSES